MSLFTDKVRDEIISLFAPDLELECRFPADTPASTYYRVMKIFSKSPGTFIKTAEYSDAGVRHIVNEDTKEETWMRKTPIKRYETTEVPLRISLSREEIISAPPSFEYQLKRLKKRTSFLKGGLRADFTIVETSKRESTKSDLSYSIEIEMIYDDKQPIRPQVEAFFRISPLFLNAYLDTNILYDISERDTIFRYFNRLLSKSGTTDMDYSIPVEARSLKLRDLASGGIIGVSPEKVAVGSQIVNYTVTHKADGERRFLAIHEKGIYLINRGKRMNCILSVSTTTPRNVTLMLKDLSGTLLDGEMIAPESRIFGRSYEPPKKGVWYLIFDCLVLRTRNVCSLHHLERMRLAQEVADLFNANDVPNIRIETKQFHGIDKDNFFAVMRKMREEWKSLPYQQDGLMFTPIEQEYNPGSRNGFQICKWKPIEFTTIDFYYKDGRIYTSEGEDKREFRLATLSDKVKSYPSGSIIEFKFEDGMLVPLRQRFDKVYANGTKTALEIWKDMNQPITFEVMEGHTFQLVFRYHGRLKRKLFEEAAGVYKAKSKGLTLLDIGSGRGGDINKWDDFKKIVAVEPNVENRAEFIRRLQENKISFCFADELIADARVCIVPAGVEETKLITHVVDRWCGKVDVISCMLSMSFMWKDERMLEAFMATLNGCISKQGRIIFLTIDGVAVEQHFRDRDQDVFGPFTYNRTKEGLEIIDESDQTILGQRQVEYLVKLSDFTNRGWSVDKQVADTEPFLTPDEKRYTRMFTYGTIIPRQDIIREVAAEIVPSTKAVPTVSTKVKSNFMGIANSRLWDRKRGSFSKAFFSAFSDEYTDENKDRFDRILAKTKNITEKFEVNIILFEREKEGFKRVDKYQFKEDYESVILVREGEEYVPVKIDNETLFPARDVNIIRLMS